MRHLRLPLSHAHAPSVGDASSPPGARARARRELARLAVRRGAAVMSIPLAMTIWYSFSRYNLLNPDVKGFAGFDNYRFLATDPSFLPAIWHTLVLIGAVLAITVIGGVLMAVLFDRKFYGQGVARLLAIAPFFVMPTVSALIWKNMILHPVYGRRERDARARDDADRLVRRLPAHRGDHHRRVAVAAVRVPDPVHRDPVARPAEGSGAHRRRAIAMFFYITLPHLKRAIAVVVMMETIFLLSIFAEIYTTTGGGPGDATTNLSYLIYALGLQQFDVGLASAGGIIAVVVANVVSFFLVRMLARNLKGEYDK